MLRIDRTFINEGRRADHDVVDVSNLDAHKGPIMIEGDGIKVYIFCYPSEYIVTFNDPYLTVHDFTVVPKKGSGLSMVLPVDVHLATPMIHDHVRERIRDLTV